MACHEDEPQQVVADRLLDGAGRVMGPRFLLDSGKLTKDVSVVGAGECLEIWDRSGWAAYNGEVLENVSEIAAGLQSAGG